MKSLTIKNKQVVIKIEYKNLTEDTLCDIQTQFNKLLTLLRDKVYLDDKK